MQHGFAEGHGQCDAVAPLLRAELERPDAGHRCITGLHATTPAELMAGLQGVDMSRVSAVIDAGALFKGLPKARVACELLLHAEHKEAVLWMDSGLKGYRRSSLTIAGAPGCDALPEPVAIDGTTPERIRQALGVGEDKVLNFLMGQIMKRSRGKADPGSARDLLVRKIRG